MNLLETLIDKKVLNRDDVVAVEKEMEETGEPLEKVLDKRGIDSDLVFKVKSEGLEIPSREVGDKSLPFEVLSYIPEESARHYKFVPLGVSDGVLEVGVTDPDNIEALDALNFISSKIGLPFKVFLISFKDFSRVVEMYKGLSGEVNKALTDLEGELSPDIKEASEKIEEDNKIDAPKQSETTSKTLKEDAPVTKIVATILRYAVEGKASDVHIEHMSENVRVRFRVDGILNTSLVLPAQVHQAVVARIKILSSMRLDEKRKPQDGRFSANVLGRRIDFRVSTFPTYYGEKVVMRILDTERGVQDLEAMGLSGRNLELVRGAVKKPFGMILVSGPTGSGKTTTLYSMLNLVDREKKNVLSLEDPVEYNVLGINQSQIRPEIGYTFANGLRTTLRQDPDIIMVGEIRDKETAQLAVQAALTGHLVLSTIHTNNAVGVIPRLIDMGVDPYLIAPTLIITVAQRLVRTLCEGSGEEIPVDGSIKLMLDKQFEDLPEKYRKELPHIDKLYNTQITPECPNGTRGRTAVFEVMQMDKEIEKIILTNPVESFIYEAARKKGMLTMKEDAIIKAFKKIVPFEEINTLGSEFLEDEEPSSEEIKQPINVPIE